MKAPLSNVDSAQAQVHAAEKAAHEAQTHLLYCSVQVQALDMARKHGLRPDDAVYLDTDKALAQASLALGAARQQLAASREALAQAERQVAEDDVPYFHKQLALVQRHEPTLFARYEDAMRSLEGATVHEQQERARYVLKRLQMRIRGYRVPPGEPA